MHIKTETLHLDEAYVGAELVWLQNCSGLKWLPIRQLHLVMYLHRGRMRFMDRSRYMYVLIELPYVTSLAVTSVQWANSSIVIYSNFIRRNYIGNYIGWVVFKLIRNTINNIFIYHVRPRCRCMSQWRCRVGQSLPPETILHPDQFCAYTCTSRT